MGIIDTIFYLIGLFLVVGTMCVICFHVLVVTIEIVFRKRKNFRNKIVLITGSANGLGKILTKKFLEMGSTVIMWDIDDRNGELTRDEYLEMFTDAEDRLFFYKVDLSKYEDIQKCAAEVQKTIGDVDVLINNAGIVSKSTIFDVTESQADLVMKVNCLSHFWTVKAFVPRMKERDSGHIVTISSAAGIIGVAGLQVYCASKFAAFGFAESLRLQFRRDKNNIDTLIVCPSYMKGQMFKGARGLRLFPLLDMEEVAEKIVEAMRNKTIELLTPWYGRHINNFSRTFLWKYSDSIQEMLKITNSMDDILDKKKDD